MTSQFREFYLKFSPVNATPSSPTSIVITPSAAEITQINSFKKMRFKTITTPIMFYAISSVNNAFALLETNDSSATSSATGTITPGNYTSSTFAVEVGNALTIAGTLSSTYSATISATTGRMQIVNDNAGTWTSFQIEFYTGNSGTLDIPSARDQAEKIWGVIPGTSKNNPQIGGGTYVTSHITTNPVQLWGPDQLLVVSDTLEKMMVKRNTDVVDNRQNIIMRVPITVTPFSQQTYTDTDSETTTTNGINLPPNINMNITDESGNGLNFNGGQCYLHVMIA